MSALLVVALAVTQGGTQPPVATPAKPPPAPLCVRLHWDAAQTPPVLVVDVACVPFRGPSLEVRIELDPATVMTASAAATANRYATVAFPLERPVLRTLTAATTVVVAIQPPAAPPAALSPTAPRPPEMADRKQLTAADILGLVAAADGQRQVDQGRETRWHDLAKSDDAAALTVLLAEDPGLPWVSDAQKRLAFLGEVTTTASLLSTTATALPEKADEVADILERLQPMAKESAQADRELGRVACLLAAATDETMPAFATAFTVLRQRETPDRWPCDADQTNFIWTRFKRSFDTDVELRADFPGAYGYLSRWHTVLERFRTVAVRANAVQAETALVAMLGKVERAAKKLPPTEACASAESQALLCDWACDAKYNAGTKRCAAFKVEKAQAVCEERNDAELETCTECCRTPAQKCPAKGALRCKLIETAPPVEPEYEN